MAYMRRSDAGAEGNRRPCTVHFNFIVVADHATLGRPTIHQIAARALAIVSFELRVEPLMPFIVTHSVVSLLRRRVYTKKHGDRAAEQRDKRAAFQGHPSSGQSFDWRRLYHVEGAVGGFRHIWVGADFPRGVRRSCAAIVSVSGGLTLSRLARP